jgi:hypothetical protein
MRFFSRAPVEQIRYASRCNAVCRSSFGTMRPVKLCFRSSERSLPLPPALPPLQLAGVDGGCGCMQFSDDDRFLAATGAGEVVCVWDMQTGLLATAFKCDKPCSVLLWGSRKPPTALCSCAHLLFTSIQAPYPRQIGERSCRCTAFSRSITPACASTL